jgi:chromosomal replication initiator protein
MTIDIQMPDFETRCAILEAKAAQVNIELDKLTVEYLANNFRTNIRELEGALNQLLAFAEMRGIEPTLETAEGLVDGSRASRPKHLTANQVVIKTAAFYQTTPEILKSPSRTKEVVLPRQIAMYLLRSELHMSFPKISNELGRKDHTTAIYGVEKIEKEYKLNTSVREHINSIRESLYQ